VHALTKPVDEKFLLSSKNLMESASELKVQKILSKKFGSFLGNFEKFYIFIFTEFEKLEHIL
jgi:hypothetical protein